MYDVCTLCVYSTGCEDNRLFRGAMERANAIPRIEPKFRALAHPATFYDHRGIIDF